MFECSFSLFLFVQKVVYPPAFTFRLPIWQVTQAHSTAVTQFYRNLLILFLLHQIFKVMVVNHAARAIVNIGLVVTVFLVSFATGTAFASAGTNGGNGGNVRFGFDGFGGGDDDDSDDGDGGDGGIPGFDN